MNILEQIKKLTVHLPQKDIKIAENLIAKRDFLSLRDLVNSAEYKIRKNLSSENPKEEYLNIDTDQLQVLQYWVSEYASQFDYDESDNSYI